MAFSISVLLTASALTAQQLVVTVGRWRERSHILDTLQRFIFTGIKSRWGFYLGAFSAVFYRVTLFHQALIQDLSKLWVTAEPRTVQSLRRSLKWLKIQIHHMVNDLFVRFLMRFFHHYPTYELMFIIGLCSGCQVFCSVFSVYAEICSHRLWFERICSDFLSK